MSKKRTGAVASLVVVLAVAPFVALKEGVVLPRYMDPVGIPTVCAGETDHEVVNYRDRFSRDECIAVLGASLYQHALELDKCITKPLAIGEAKAVLSWSYNVGTGAACKSTLMRLLNQGAPAAEWCKQLLRWDKAKGKRLLGLTIRRKEEYAMCIGATP
ncbi:lysozyme [Lysobacter olei]